MKLSFQSLCKQTQFQKHIKTILIKQNENQIFIYFSVRVQSWIWAALRPRAERLSAAVNIAALWCVRCSVCGVGVRVRTAPGHHEEAWTDRSSLSSPVSTKRTWRVYKAQTEREGAWRSAARESRRPCVQRVWGVHCLLFL